jgi:protein-tyrosine phosphatase
MRLLFVCTGNLCRSPLAEGLTRAWLSRAWGAEAGQVEVLSAGTNVSVGEPMDELSAAALIKLGGDPRALRATALTADLADGADLVLTMTRRHRRAVLELSPRGLRRTFTLLEASDLIRHAEVRDLARLPLDARARELGLRLDAGRGHRASTDDDDIFDPIGRRRFVHDDVADTIARALRPVLPALFSAPAPRTAPSRREGMPLRA